MKSFGHVTSSFYYKKSEQFQTFVKTYTCVHIEFHPFAGRKELTTLWWISCIVDLSKSIPHCKVNGQSGLPTLETQNALSSTGIKKVNLGRRAEQKLFNKTTRGGDFKLSSWAMKRRWIEYGEKSRITLCDFLPPQRVRGQICKPELKSKSLALSISHYSGDKVLSLTRPIKSRPGNAIKSVDFPIVCFLRLACWLGHN
jgi:hypothetical protein